MRILMLWQIPQAMAETGLKQRSTWTRSGELDAPQQHNLCSYPEKVQLGLSPTIKILLG
jgi:hypothetical protein